MNKSELLTVLAGLKGAAPSIMLALLLSDDPLSRGELELITGYSGITVGRALELLLARQYVYIVGSGYALSRGVRSARTLADAQAENVPHDSPIPATRLSSNSDPPDLPGDELIKKFFLHAPSSSSYTQQEVLIDPEEEEEARRREKILGLLARAGVSGKSKKGAEIADAGLDPVFVEAHIAAREKALARGEQFPISWLITKLLDGDPAPAPDARHCPECGGRLTGGECLVCSGVIRR